MRTISIFSERHADSGAGSRYFARHPEFVKFFHSRRNAASYMTAWNQRCKTLHSSQIADKLWIAGREDAILQEEIIGGGAR